MANVMAVILWILPLFVLKDNMNMNVKSGACGNGGDDEDDEEDGETADMEGMAAISS